MPYRILDVTTPRGTMPVHVTVPDGPGPFPLVVLFMDAPGVRAALFEHADRLGAAGYATALPDLYYRLAAGDRPDPERLRYGIEAEFERMVAAVSTLRDAEVIEDTRCMLDALEITGPWGCVGFCAGARFGLRAAEQLGADVLAVALLHPSRLVTEEPDSPHRELAGTTSALYFAFGENDRVTPLSVLAPLHEQLEDARVPYRIEVIPNADHGFTMPGMPAYNEAAAERAWKGTLGLLAERLRIDAYTPADCA